MAASKDSTSLRLVGWASPGVLGVTLVAFGAGFGQFGAVAALGDVAKSFGHVIAGTTIADQAGLSGTTLSIGLAVLRLASLGALPLSFLADLQGRRRILLLTAALGLAITVVAAASPGYWWFVAIFALGRPLLSASTAVGQVIVAEITGAPNRARAVALVTAGYGLGAGLTAFLHGVASSALGFRGLFLLALVPLFGLAFVAHLVPEPDRYLAAKEMGALRPSLGRVPRALHRRLLLVSAIAFFVALTTGPATGFVYVDAENIVKLSGVVVGAMVASAGVLGALGLYLGQLSADRYGRRPTGGSAMVAIAASSMLTYSGAHWALVAGYVVGVLCASLLAPTAGAFVNELFPTGVRAQVAGWLVVASVLGAVAGLLCFGAIADAGGSLGVAGAATFAPTAVASLLFLPLPETRGLEPEAVELEG